MSLHRIPIYRRPPFLIALGAALLGALILCFIVFAHSPKPNPDEPSPASADTPASQVNASPQEPAITDPELPTDEQPAEAPEPPARYEGADPNRLPELTGYITSQHIDSARDILSLTAVIDQYLSSEGECHLDLYEPNSTSPAYSLTTPAIADVTTSLCRPFEIPLSALPASSYRVEISLSAVNKTGTISGTVNL